MSSTQISAEERLKNLSKDQSQLLKLLLEEKARSARKIKRYPRDGHDGVVRLPTSWAQQRLWFIDQLEGRSEAYHIPVALTLHGPLSEPALQNALDALIRRHEILRTVFVNVDGDPKQEIGAPAAFRLEVVDLSAYEPAEQATQLQLQKFEEARTKFDLRTGPLVRGRLLRIQSNEHVLLITMHHIISDGWSMGVLMGEFAALYCAHGDGVELEPLPIQYADYAMWQRDWLKGAVRDDQLRYWCERLQGAPAQLELPTDRPRPPIQSFRGENVEVALNAGLTANLRAFAHAHDLTLFMVLYAGWTLLLGRLSGFDDVVVGTPIANRQQAELEGLIGFFVNTLALRVGVEQELTLEQFLKQVKEATLSAYRHQDIPFEQVVEAVQPQRSLSRNPIFQVMFALQTAPRSELHLSDVIATVQTEAYEFSMFDLMLSLEERGDQVVGTLNYATDLFDRETVERWIESFKVLLEAMSGGLQARIGELPILPEGGRNQVIEAFNATGAEYPQEKLIHELFEEQVGRTPNALALEYLGEQQTYAQLDARADLLANYLRSRGVGPDQLVGVCVERGVELVVSLLGILKAGAAYLPLDPNYPAERLQHMLEDAGPRAVITQRALVAALPPIDAELIELDTKQEEIASCAGKPEAAKQGMTSRNLLYVIYTSGSTGRPKGTAMPHRAMVNLMEWHRRSFEANEGKRVLQFAALSFDVAFQEIFSTLCTGGTLLLVDEWVRRDAQALTDFLVSNSVERLFVPPLMLQSLAQHAKSADRVPTHLRDIVTAGEQLRVTPEIREFVRRLGGCRLHNHYGPTESHVVTALTLSGDPQAWPALPSIGRPIANTYIYVLDARMQPVPVGVAGEIYIGGANLARGYLNRPELSAQRFVPDPFSAESQARMYKTGDLGRWRVDGTIEYLGRNDDQVKIRGFRIELGEIEAQLAQHAQVKEAAVIVREDVPGDKRLAAYVTPRVEGARINAEELSTHLKASLPEHMVPAAFVVLDRLPVTPSGKLDRRALPAPSLDAYVTRTYEAPQGEVEEILAGIWGDLLKIQRVGRHDNFFKLGGHSLLIVQMLEKLRRIGLSAAVRSVYGSPTLMDLAQTLRRERERRLEVPPNLIPHGCEQITPQMLPLIELESDHIERIGRAIPGGQANIQDIYPLAPLQEGMLFHHLLNEGGDTYIVPMLLSLPSRQRVQDFIDALQKVIDRHDILRTAIMWEQLPRPVQVVQRSATLPVEEISLDSALDPLEQLKQRMKPEHQRIDLQQAPMLRLQMIEDAGIEQWHVLLQMHHLVCDHESLDLTVAEVIAHLEGQAHLLPKPAPYRDHVAQSLALAREHDADAFFGAKVGEIDEPTAPFGLLDVHGDGSRLDEAHEPLDSDLARRVRIQARRLNVSAATLFHAVWALVVSRTSGRDDVVFGTVLLGRLQGSAGAQRTLGMFINTLPIRLALQRATAEELVERVQRELVELLQHEQASLAVAQRCSGVVSPAPLFTALLNYRHSRMDLDAELARSGVKLHSVQNVTNYPIVFSVDDRGEQFLLDIVTDQRIDPHRVMSYVCTAMRSLVEALENSESINVAELSVIPESEQQLLVEKFNAARADYLEEALLHELFEAQAARTPDRVAVVSGGESITFEDLNRRANQLAHHMRGLGVGPDQPVGLCVERSVELVVGMLGILKAGGAYLPLDPDYPPDRLHYMLDEAAPRVVLTQGRLRMRLPSGATDVIAIDEQRNEIERQSAGNPDAGALRSHHLAYVIYTSGSTGRPKGVMIEHRNVVNLWGALQSAYRGIQDCQRVAVNASYAFDASVKQFIQLLSGRTLYIVPQDFRLDAAMLLDFIAEYRIDAMDCTPSQLRSWISAGLLTDGRNPLRLVLVGGEPIDAALWRRLSESSQTQFYNVYGPTECTVDATIARVGGDTQDPTIGRPITNARVYLRDRNNRLVPLGVVGEIQIGGVGVARGYFNRQELTRQRFIPDPFSADSRSKLYKTGDLARWRADGALEYVGRNDDQVKIRGFRIELGEIEARLNEHARVREAVVLAREDVPGDKRLVAYLTLNSSTGVDSSEQHSALPSELRAHLSATLPEYMTPSAFVMMESWPLTPSGKLDRRALPAAESDAYASQYYESPQGEAEEVLASIWRELLQVERIGRNDNFFELGGNSLLIVQVMERLRKAGLSAKVRSIYSSPTLRDLARTLVGGDGDEFVAPPNLIPPGCEAITPKMLSLVDLAQVHIDRISASVPGGAANIQDIYPLAPLQEGMLFHHLLGEQSGDTYVRPILLSLSSRQRLEEFTRALQRVIDRHDILRTAVMWEELPGPVQVVQRRATLILEELALNPDQDPIEQLKERMKLEYQKLDLRRAPMMRLQAASDSKSEQCYALLQLHHLASDHESTDIMLAELMACLEGRDHELPQPLPYRDHVAHSIAQVRMHDAESFFRRKLGDVDEPTAPFGLLDVYGDGRRLHQAHESLDLPLARRARAQARRLAVSAATLFHAACALVIARTSGRDDVVFGSVLLGRMQGSTGAQRTLGMFMNTLPLRVRLQGVGAKQLVEQTQRELVELINYEQASLAEAQRCSAVAGTAPLFTALLNYRHSAVDVEPELAEAGVKFLAFHNWTNFPIMIAVDDHGDAFTITAKVDLGLDPLRIVGYMRTAMESLIEALEKSPSKPVLDLLVLPELERRKVVEIFNDTQASYPQDKLIHELFEEQAQRSPGAEAVRWAGVRLTYEQLDRHANQLAHYLRRHGVRRGERVGICMERSSHMLVGMLAALKSGAAYVPVDSSAPRERLRYLLEDSSPKVVLIQEKFREHLPQTNALVVASDAQWGEISNESTHAIDRGELTSEDLVYVMYTSGSTGLPKGVMVRHRNIVNYSMHAARQFDIAAGEGSLVATSLNFDLCLTGLYPTLICGRPLVLSPEDEDISQAILEGRNYAPVKLTPTHLTMLALPERESEGHARTLVVGGEPLRGAILRWWRQYSPQTRIFNHYGPTEATVGCVVYEVTQDIEGPVPIGRPISNARVYILDERQSPTPIGVVGEIYIGGAGVAGGYWNRPELTAQRFVQDPFSPGPQARMYRTGDLGRWRADGNIELLGRNDHQVKIRGFRVELGEIETQLMRHESVREAVIDAREDAPGDKRLIAYVTRKEGVNSVTVEELHLHLKGLLPDYMLPSAFVVLDRLPVTPNGKLNRRSLPAPELGAYLTREYEPPLGAVEQVLAEVWREMLRVERVGRNDNFFELGGHSLHGLRLIAKVSERFGVKLSPIAVFQSPTIREMAKVVEAGSPVRPPATAAGSVEEGVI